MMQEVVHSGNWVSRFDDVDHDVRFQQALESLETENSRLKELVVRLSETIIRNVTAKQ
jgi:hypothetical protein